MPPFEGLWDLPWDLVDYVLCFLMTVLRETHLIPNPHLNLFLSRRTVTHTEVQHVNISQNCRLLFGAPVAGPSVPASLIQLDKITQPGQMNNVSMG